MPAASFGETGANWLSTFGRCVRPTRANRTRPACRRLKLVGRLAVNGKAGANSRRFSGRIRGRALRRGEYRLILVATDAAGNRSARVTLRFRIVRP